MELADLVRTRRMVRRYDPDRAVPPSAIAAVVDAAVRAPSAGFTQAVSYVVLTGEDVSDYWAATTDPNAENDWLTGMRTAPVLILVFTDEAAYLDRYALPDKGWTDRDPARWAAPYWWVDAGMGVMLALLTAADQGLGCCFFGVPPDRAAAVRERFGVPPEQASVGVISLGYVASEPSSGRRRGRRARGDLIHVGRWRPVGHPERPFGGAPSASL